jgi:hypothetical protein
MASGTIGLRLRPLKLGFVLNPNDREALLFALEINSFIWGGMFNPIIPRSGKIPRDGGAGFRNPGRPRIL